MTRWLLFFLVGTTLTVRAQTRFYVAPSGKDSNPGTITLPLATLSKALEKVKTAPQNTVRIFLRKGTYYLSETVRINPEIIQDKALIISNFQNEKVTISGGKLLKLHWQKTAQKVWMAQVDSSPFEQIFLNGKKQVLARYPNYDANARVFNGTSADALSESRVRSWKSPEGGFIHALHQGEWGDFHYRITGKMDKKLQQVGGWQNNRPSPMHPKERFVENIFEEMDAPASGFMTKRPISCT